MYRQPSQEGALTRGPNPLGDRGSSGQSQVNIHFRKPATIYSLPPELLLLIFDGYEGLPELWVQAAHVCRLWREVVHNSPILWRNIRVTQNSLDWLRHCLKLSAPLLVSVDVNLTASVDFEEVKHVLEESSDRIEDLLIHGTGMESSRPPVTLELPNFANLTKLDVVVGHSTHLVSQPDSPTSPLLVLNSARYPKLETLKLCGLNVLSDDPNFLSKLTELHFVLCGWAGYGRNILSPAAILGLLSQCNSLVHLELGGPRGLMDIVDCLPQESFQIQGKGPLVKLPKLVSLCIMDNTSRTIPCLLSNMIMPSDVAIQLSLYIEPNEVLDPPLTLTDHLLKVLPDEQWRHRLPILSEARRIRIRTDEHKMVYFSAWPEDDIGELLWDDGRINISVSFAEDHSTLQNPGNQGALPSNTAQLFRRDTLEALIPADTLQKVQTFICCADLSEESLQNPETWSTLLSDFPELFSIVAYNIRDDCKGSLVPLINALGEHGMQQDGEALCPSLTSLSIGEVAEEETLFDALKTTIGWRAREGVPMEWLFANLKPDADNPLTPQARSAHHDALSSLVWRLDTKHTDAFFARWLF